MIAGLFILWLIWLIIAQRRAIRANRMFVAEIAAPVPRTSRFRRATQSVAAVGAKFQEIMAELRRRKLGNRKFLRDMPWYVIVGPPATGKTTALRQSGLNFPDRPDRRSAGRRRYAQLRLVLLRECGADRHRRPLCPAGEPARCRRHGMARLPRSAEETSRPPRAERRDRRAVRRRAVGGRRGDQGAWPQDPPAPGRAERAAGNSPAGLSDADQGGPDQGLRAVLRRSVDRPSASRCGAPPSRSTRGSTRPRSIASEISTLARELERRLVPQAGGRGQCSPHRAEIFRFPAQLESLSEPIQVLVDAMFGESRYEESAWLRGIYLTSATQEGAPIDRLTAALSSSFGLPARRADAGASASKSAASSCKNLLTEVIFREAGLGTFDPAGEAPARLDLARRRGGVAVGGAAGRGAVHLSYFDNRNAIAAQAGQFEALQATADAVCRGSLRPVDPLDLDVALARRWTTLPARARRALRRRTRSDRTDRRARTRRGRRHDAYNQALRNMLEPRMVALLEATMWRQIRDPEFLLGALKTYRMMTGLSQMDTEFAQDWWVNELPAIRAGRALPDGRRRRAPARRDRPHGGGRQLYRARPGAGCRGAEERLHRSRCRARLQATAADPAVAELKEWIPANFAGPNGAKVLARRSDKTLRVGISGAYTYEGFHNAVLDRRRGCRRAGRARPRGVRRRLFGKRRDLCLRALGGYPQALLRGLSSRSGTASCATCVSRR